MAEINLTEKTLSKIIGTDKLVFHWDTNLPGFGVYAKGKALRYAVRGYVHGKRVLYVMGKCDLYESVKVAREEARELLSKMAKGSTQSLKKKQRGRPLKLTGRRGSPWPKFLKATLKNVRT